MTDLDIKIQWHTPDLMWAAVLMRDGKEWYLDGALVGIGDTPDRAVADLLGVMEHLIREGENFLTDGQISRDDREWLFRLLDRGNDGTGIQERYEAVRRAGINPYRSAPMKKVDKITCPRCGEYAKVARSGPYAGMLCDDCALAKRYEALEERERRK